MRAPHNTSCSHTLSTAHSDVMLPTALCWFLGALLLIVGVLASLYLVWLQTQRGVSTFSLLATSDALATVAIAVAFLVNATHSQSTNSRTSMKPSQCSHGQLTLASALFLAPFVNTFVSMIAHSAESMRSARSGIEARGHEARNNPRVLSSIAAQWIVPAISTLMLFSAGIQQSRPYRTNVSDTCMEGTALTPIPVESMEQCLHQEDISDYIIALMNTHNLTTKNLLINNTQSSDSEVNKVVDNIYKILQIQRVRRSSPARGKLTHGVHKLIPTQSFKTDNHLKSVHQINKWKQISKFQNKKPQISNMKSELVMQSTPLGNKHGYSKELNIHSKLFTKPNEMKQKVTMDILKSQTLFPNTNRNIYKSIPQFTNEEESRVQIQNSQQQFSQLHQRVKDKTSLLESSSNQIIKNHRSPRSSPLKNTPEDADYYDTTDEYYDKGDEESPSEFEDENEPSEAPPLNTIQPESTSPTEPEVTEINTSEAPLTPSAVTTTQKSVETDLTEIQIPDTLNMCVIKCYLSDMFLKKYLFVLLFLCYFIPITASLIMYFSTPNTQINIDMKPSTADESCSNMQSSKLPSTTTVKHSILSSVLLWSPTLVETLLRAWFCVSTPQWLTVLLFMLAQVHAIIRNSINVQLVRKRACSASVQPLADSEDTPSKLFTKVKEAILK